MILERDSKRCMNFKGILIDDQRAWNNAFHTDTVNTEYAFDADFILTLLRKADGLDQFSGKGGHRVSRGFHIVFHKVLPLHRAVESLEGINPHGKRHAAGFRLNCPTELSALSRNEFEGSIRGKACRASIPCKHLVLRSQGNTARSKKQNQDEPK